MTGGWILPQHILFYDGLYDELKLSGRVTLQNPDHYAKVLDSYVKGTDLMPNEIGGGPASAVKDIHISRDFFSTLLKCDLQCQNCGICENYYQTNIDRK